MLLQCSSNHFTRPDRTQRLDVTIVVRQMINRSRRKFAGLGVCRMRPQRHDDGVDRSYLSQVLQVGLLGDVRLLSVGEGADRPAA